ncbi:MAG: PQQ-like beta-propeller repeat protein [Pyrinomonadaceae bacterium]|nr:PQQ-like beta-propeller repeat protein [Pyrinomonadaceae bacterium]
MIFPRLKKGINSIYKKSIIHTQILIIVFLILFSGPKVKAQNPKIYGFCKELKLNSPQMIASDNATIFLYSDSKVIAVDSDSLTKNWDYELNGQLLTKTILNDEKLILKTISEDKNERSTTLLEPLQFNNIIINSNTGIPIEISEISVENNPSSEEGHRENINFADSKLDDKIVIKRKIDSKYILGYIDGTIVLIDSDLKTLFWKTKVGGEVTGIMPLKSGILVSSKDNFLYFLNSVNANKIWKKRMSGRILNILNIDGDLVAPIVPDSKEISLIDVVKGVEVGKILEENKDKIIDVKKFSHNILILLTESGLAKYSVNRCKDKEAELL